MVPDEGLTSPQINEISVVLPAPLGPNNAKISPSKISKETSSKAVTIELFELYVLERLFKLTIGSKILFSHVPHFLLDMNGIWCTYATRTTPC